MDSCWTALSRSFFFASVLLSMTAGCNLAIGFEKKDLPTRDGGDGPSCTDNIDCDDGHPCTTDICDFPGGICIHFVSDSSVVCRPPVDDCDEPETCDGTSSECPADGFFPAGRECRAAAGECDVAEQCDGSSASCPPDLFVPSGTDCGESTYCVAYACDAAGSCNPGVEREFLYGVTALTVGGMHACGLLDGGGVKCWGGNGEGQLGDGTTSNRTAPVDVSALPADISAVSAGWQHTCALRDTGEILCWGWNEYGQLGDGSTTGSPTPVGVLGLPSAAVSVSAGGHHTCAILDTGSVVCWGWNEYGQLGDGTTSNSPTPVDVSGLSAGVEDVSLGSQHTCALLDTGGIKCWGFNWFGQVGDGTNGNNRLLPVDVFGLTSGVETVITGWRHTCAILASGDMMCWGRNESGMLGNGTTTDASSPVEVPGITWAAAAAAGNLHTCAVLDAGGILCWGSNEEGQLGDGSTDDSLVPVYVSDPPADVTAIDAGVQHNCVLLGGGEVHCWGWNYYGQLGIDSTGDSTTPVAVHCR
jgi:alpha-tubulin suppressor-like RCC1 family protein